MTKRLPLTMLAILLIALLAGLGVAYGLWSEKLTIFGTVNTGEVNVEFGTISIVEKVETPNGVVNEPPDKASAANCSYEIKYAGTDWEELAITTQGAYPSWHCIVTFEVKSTGSVPVHIYRPDPVQGRNWVTFDDCYDDDTQLHQGDSASCTMTIHFTNDDNLAEKSTYYFTYQIEARRWNEPR